MSETAPPRPLAAPMPAKHNFKPLKECRTLEEAFATHEFMERIQASVPQHVQPGRMLRTFVSAVSKMPLLAKADLRTFLGACLTASQVGLEPNTPLGHLWLLPFKTKHWDPQTRRRDKEVVEINVIFGYPGLLDLSYRTSKVKAVHADVVWPGDEFSFEYGTNAHLKHRPRGHKPDDRPLYAYMHAGLDGGQAFEVMPYDDVLAIRNKSQAYRYALAAKDDAITNGRNLPRTYTDAPWVAHEIAMARKTAFRAGSKWLPRSVELASAIALDEAQERRTRMDFATVMDAPTIDGTPDYLGAAADAATSPETDDADEPAPRVVDATAAFGRRPEAALSERRSEPTLVEVRASRQTVPAPAVIPPAPESDFEAVLIDAFGEIQGDFISPVAFAEAFLRLYEPADDAERAALSDHNADALEEAQQDARAAAILMHMAQPRDEDATVQPNVLPPISVVEPAQERGKTAWTRYVKSLKSALAMLPAQQFDAWASAQRATLERCPAASRHLAVRAIAETARLQQRDPPSWLADLLRPNVAAETNALEQPAEPADSTQAAELSAADPDERWVNNQIAQIAVLADRAQFDQLVSSNAVRTIMARLRRDKPALFARADAAFSAKHQSLPKAEAQ